MVKVIVFDWDDTLFPTYITHKNTECKLIISDDIVGDIDPLGLRENEKKSLAKLDEFLISLFDSILEKSFQLFIITNSEQGWIEHTVQLYLPKTKHWINHMVNLSNSSNPSEKSNRFKIISAQHTYKELFPENQIMWKVQAFKKIVADSKDKISDFISIGDGIAERVALKMIAKENKEICAKSVQFINFPTQIEVILTQLSEVAKIFDGLVKTPKNLDLKVDNNYIFLYQNDVLTTPVTNNNDK